MYNYFEHLSILFDIICILFILRSRHIACEPALVLFLSYKKNFLSGIPFDDVFELHRLSTSVGE